MQLAPLFVVGLLYVWMFLAALGWAVAELLFRHEPAFRRLALSVGGAIGGIGLALLVGHRGGLSLVLSFPLCLGAAMVTSGSAICLERSARWNRNSHG
jgi:hypothetical protein